MEGQRALFALPGNGSGTNSLGGWLNALAGAATGIDLMGNTEGSECQYLFISTASQGRERRLREHVCPMEIYVCLETDLSTNTKGEMRYDIQLKSRLHLQG